MKKTFTLFLAATLIAGFFNTKAAVVNVFVGNLQFNPSDFTINSGDTIIWTWADGDHTTTSTQIPQGAIPWDEDIENSSPVYMYSPTIAGSYNYVCSPHASMGMTGHFTVINTSGLAENHLHGATLSSALLNSDQLLVKFNLPNSSLVSVRLFDMIGNSVSTFMADARIPAGTFEEKFMLPALKDGIYLLQLQTSEGTLTKRILIP